MRSFRSLLVFAACIPLLAAAVPTRPAAGSLASGEVSRGNAREIAVDRDDFEGRRLAWSYFQALAQRDDVMIIDVRSGFLPPSHPPGLQNVRPIPLEIFLTNFVARKAHQDKTLLLFDESGQEMPRLQFHLQKHGYDDYFFLEGGADGVSVRQGNGS